MVPSNPDKEAAGPYVTQVLAERGADPILLKEARRQIMMQNPLDRAAGAVLLDHIDKLTALFRDDTMYADALSRALKAERVLKRLLRNPNISLGNLDDVREREGKGFEGPNVTAWGEATTEAEALVKDVEAREQRLAAAKAAQ